MHEAQKHVKGADYLCSVKQKEEKKKNEQLQHMFVLLAMNYGKVTCRFCFVAAQAL